MPDHAQIARDRLEQAAELHQWDKAQDIINEGVLAAEQLRNTQRITMDQHAQMVGDIKDAARAAKFPIDLCSYSPKIGYVLPHNEPGQLYEENKARAWVGLTDKVAEAYGTEGDPEQEGDPEPEPEPDDVIGSP